MGVVIEELSKLLVEEEEAPVSSGLQFPDSPETAPAVFAQVAEMMAKLPSSFKTRVEMAFQTLWQTGNGDELAMIKNEMLNHLAVVEFFQGATKVKKTLEGGTRASLMRQMLAKALHGEPVSTDPLDSCAAKPATETPAEAEKAA